MLNKQNYKYNVIEKNEFYNNIPLVSYTCHVDNHKCSSILIIGDSHSIPLIGMLYNYCKLNNILIYYKCIHTTYLVFDKRKDLYDISLLFSLIIITHHYSKIIHSNSTNLVEKLRSYILYLKQYTKYVIYILPTPYLYNTHTCEQQKSKRTAIINKDIDSNYFSVKGLSDIKYLKILNFTKFFCNSIYCNLINNNTCIYLDANHLTEKYIIYLTPCVMNNIKLYNFKNEKKCSFFYNNSYILLNNKMDKLWRVPQKSCYIDYIDVPY